MLTQIKIDEIVTEIDDKIHSAESDLKDAKAQYLTADSDMQYQIAAVIVEIELRIRDLYWFKNNLYWFKNNISTTTTNLKKLT